MNAVGSAAGGAERALSERTIGLNDEARLLLQRAELHLAAQRADAAHVALDEALAQVPDHPELLRLNAIALQLLGQPAAAMAALERALAQRPEDALIWNTLGAVRRQLGDGDGAMTAFLRACEYQPDLAGPWFNIGATHQHQGEIQEAHAALLHAIECDPRYVAAHIALAGTHKMLGDIDAAAREYREAIRLQPEAVRAWAGLADLKTEPLGEAESAKLDALHARLPVGGIDRATAGFALARTLEERAEYPRAFAVLGDANAIIRQNAAWDAAAHSDRVDAIMRAFATVPLDASERDRGNEVIFVVSIPRSGSTLTEQILGAHPDVEGAGEIPDLARILHEESARRRRNFSDWVPDATPADWSRLGKRYLEQTERWRQTRVRHVDKALFNWPLLGAALSMLPGARIVNCRRDPVETCWSCFKQLFAMDQQTFAYDLQDLARYWTDYDRLMYFWHARFPGRILDFDFETLTTDPEPAIRRLLAFCELEFHPACLRPDRHRRGVRTASAAQVRQPLHPVAPRAPHYGALLDPLRRALGVPA